MDKNTTELIKNIDNDMSPRFGHTITLGKFRYFIQFINLRLFFSVEQQVLMEDFVLIQIPTFIT